MDTGLMPFLVLVFLVLLLMSLCIAAGWLDSERLRALAEAARLRRRIRYLETELAAQRQLTQANAAALLSGVFGISQGAAASLLEPIETLTEEEYGRE